MQQQRIVIVDRQGRILSAEPRLPAILFPRLAELRLPADLELLLRHATRGWRNDPAWCGEARFSYDAEIAVRVFPLLEGGLIRVGLSLGTSP